MEIPASVGTCWQHLQEFNNRRALVSTAPPMLILPHQTQLFSQALRAISTAPPMLILPHQTQLFSQALRAISTAPPMLIITAQNLTFDCSFCYKCSNFARKGATVGSGCNLQMITDVITT